jgi:V/A-type H+-transporting ATPase subunit A
LDANLAYKRHFPAINWLTSYSLYTDLLSGWFHQHVDADWMPLRGRMLHLLQEEAELDEIVKLVGMDALSPSDRLKMETARSIREDFLHQLAFHEVDTYTSLQKQLLMMRLILNFYDLANETLGQGGEIEKIVTLPVREEIGRFKYVPEDQIGEAFGRISTDLVNQMKETIGEERL